MLTKTMKASAGGILADQSSITVTSTASSLAALIATATGETEAHIESEMKNFDSIDVQPESIEIRVLTNGDTPAATYGFPVLGGQLKQYRDRGLSQMKLWAASDSVVQIELGTSK